jgi:hypothetical protein
LIVESESFDKDNYLDSENSAFKVNISTETDRHPSFKRDTKTDSDLQNGSHTYAGNGCDEIYIGNKGSNRYFDMEENER